MFRVGKQWKTVFLSGLEAGGGGHFGEKSRLRRALGSVLLAHSVLVSAASLERDGSRNSEPAACTSRLQDELDVGGHAAARTQANNAAAPGIKRRY